MASRCFAQSAMTQPSIAHQSPNQHRHYLNQIPEDFEMRFKVWKAITITIYAHQARYGMKAGQPRFLDAKLFNNRINIQVHRMLARHPDQSWDALSSPFRSITHLGGVGQYSRSQITLLGLPVKGHSRFPLVMTAKLPMRPRNPKAIQGTASHR